MMDVRIRGVSPDYAVATWRNVVIGMWRTQPKAESVRVCYEASKDVLRENPSGHAHVIIAERPSSPPDAEARGVFLKMMREFNGRTTASAVLAEGGSLSMSVVRGVLTGLLIVARHDTPTKMFGKVHDAGVWLRSELQKKNIATFTAEELVAVVDSLRRKMDAAEPGKGAPEVTASAART